MRLHVPVHNPFGMTEIERLVDDQHGDTLHRARRHAHLKQLVHVEPHVVIGEAGIEDFEVDVMNAFCDEAWYFRCRVAHNIEQSDYVRTTSEVLEDLDLTLDLLLLHGLQDFDDALLVCEDVDAFEDLRTLG